MYKRQVLLGSATPSVDSYYQAMQGKYQLLTLSERVEKKPLPDCEVVDLRSELRAGGRYAGDPAAPCHGAGRVEDYATGDRPDRKWKSDGDGQNRTYQ